VAGTFKIQITRRLGLRQSKESGAPALLGPVHNAQCHTAHGRETRHQSADWAGTRFRHTYSTLLRATGADIKVMQELLRHASARVTLDTYTRRLPRRSAMPKVPWSNC